MIAVVVAVVAVVALVVVVVGAEGYLLVSLAVRIVGLGRRRGAGALRTGHHGGALERERDRRHARTGGVRVACCS